MKSLFLALIYFTIVIFVNATANYDACLPLWPRIQFGSIYTDPSSAQKMVIKFNTRSECPQSYAVISDSQGNIRKTYCQPLTIKGSQKMNNYTAFMQRCSISQINFDQFINYIVYGANTTSGTAIPYNTTPTFTHMLHPNATRNVQLILLADWSELHQKIGIYKSLNDTFTMLYQTKVIDGIIVNGDLAYDLDSNNGTNYEEFLNILSRASINVPAFFVTGNHQHNSEDTLKLYYETFEQYGADKKLANGISMGPLFFATFDPYGDIYKNSKSDSHLRKESIGGVAVQGFTEALNNGSKLNKVIIPISHYPLKCSAPAKNCQNDTIILKSYFDVMFRYNLPFYIGAHYHTYERVYPYCPDGTFDLKPAPYYIDQNFKCIVSIIEGIAGNDDKIVETYPQVKNYTAKLSFNKTGLGLITANSTQLNYKHFSSDNVLTLEDEFNIFFKEPNLEILRSS